MINIADLFCGAGGTSTGAVEAIEMLGMTPRLTAVNHWDVAIATHTANHPSARHLCTSLDNINPRDLFSEGELDVLWASPECTHHSVARGGKPINDQSRSTAWCVVRWGEALRPNVILVENVPEFETWGGIGTDGRPLKSKRGATFLAWVASLESLGYRVDWRVLCAADYGDPTTRRRLFVQAVRGKLANIWPEPTHSPVAFDDILGSRRRAWVTAREIIDWKLPGQSIYERKRPLSPKTMSRIMEGLKKFGLKPFIVPQHSSNGPRSTDDPVPTVTTTSRGVGMVEPFILTMEHQGSIRSSGRPLPTITTAKGGAMAVVQPFLVETAHGGNRRPRGLAEPMATVAGNRGGVALIEPALLPQNQGGALRPVSQPAPTVATDGAIGLVEPFLVEYYGSGGSTGMKEPVGTVTCRDRFGLVRPIVTIKGAKYLLDIRFRMLQPHELAAAQGFRRDYKFTGNKSEQVKQIGNAVPRNLARALCLAVLSQRSDISGFLEKEAA